MKFEYTDITSPGCEGEINLFYAGYCIAFIRNVALASQIKLTTPELGSGSDKPRSRHDDSCPVCNGAGFNGSQPPCGFCGATNKKMR